MNKELKQIQEKLKVPKSQYNSFGKYYYRNCEDILQKVKYLQESFNFIVKLNDEVIQIGNRIYVKATASFKSESGVETSVAFARETENKKGMDASQLTGTASSYARKYALNGLFAIDDTKDADTEQPKQQLTKTESNLISEKQLKKLNYEINRTKTDRKKIKEYYNIVSLKNLNKNQVSKLIEKLVKKQTKNKGEVKNEINNN